VNGSLVVRTATLRLIALVLICVPIFPLSACSDRKQQLPVGGRVWSQEARPSEPAAVTSQYLPRELLEAPARPPTAIVTTGGRNATPITVARDWYPEEPSKPYVSDRIIWPSIATISGRRWIFQVATSLAPHRIVYYRYSRVDRNGMPDENSGKEEFCRFREPHFPCWYDQSDKTKQITVSIDHKGGGEYFVVQAAWWKKPAASNVSDEEVFLSWAFSTTRLSD